MRRFFIPIFITVLGITLYFPVFSVGFVGDDVPQLVKFAHFHKLTSALSIFHEAIATNEIQNSNLLGFFYRPLTFSIYTLLYYYTHGNPFYFHILQFLIYISAVYLLFLFFTTYFSRRLSLILATVFLVHPANTELAGYIAALADTLCLFFGLFALNILAKTRRSSFLAIILVCVLLFLSLMSKEAGILFVVLAGVYILIKKEFRIYSLPLILTTGIYLVLRMNASANVLFHTLTNPFGDLSFLERMWLVPQMTYALIREIIIPTRTALKPGAFQADFQASIFPLIMLIFFTAVAGIIWLGLKKVNKKKASVFSFFLLWIILGLVLYAQIVPLEVVFADRWLYVAEIGILGTVGVLFSTLPIKRNRWTIMGGVLIGILLFLYVAETLVINFKWQVWHDSSYRMVLK